MSALDLSRGLQALIQDLLQKLLEENTKLLTMSESEKKISDVDTVG